MPSHHRPRRRASSPSTRRRESATIRALRRAAPTGRASRAISSTSATTLCASAARRHALRRGRVPPPRGTRLLPALPLPAQQRLLRQYRPPHWHQQRCRQVLHLRSRRFLHLVPHLPRHASSSCRLPSLQPRSTGCRGRRQGRRHRLQFCIGRLRPTGSIGRLRPTGCMRVPKVLRRGLLLRGRHHSHGCSSGCHRTCGSPRDRGRRGGRGHHNKRSWLMAGQARGWRPQIVGVGAVLRVSLTARGALCVVDASPGLHGPVAVAKQYVQQTCSSVYREM